MAMITLSWAEIEKDDNGLVLSGDRLPISYMNPEITALELEV